MTEEKQKNQSYLMWVGTQHYPKILDYVEEVARRGVSKRLPNENVAGGLLKPGTIIFIVHDEGKTQSCNACLGLAQNPCYRIARNALTAHERGQEALDNELLKAHEDDEEERIESIEKRRDNANNKHSRLKREFEKIEEFVVTGTGGTILVDNEPWDYRRYKYWLHQPNRWAPSAHDIDGEKMCKACGGTGTMPLGKIFGLCIPSAIEYIMRPEDSPSHRRKMEDKGFRVISASSIASESPRDCGERQHGGYYAVTDEDEGFQSVEALKQFSILDSWLTPSEEVLITGKFIHFSKYVDTTTVKRFRGIKKWNVLRESSR